MANLIGQPSVDWKKTADFHSKSSVDSKETADFSGKWHLLEMDEDSFLKFFEAMGSPDPRAGLQVYKNAAQHEIIDKGYSVIFNYPDQSAEGGRRKLDLTVGQEWVGKGPGGFKMKIFATREGNKLNMDVTSPTGKHAHGVNYELQGDKVLYSMTEHGTGITATMVLMRKSRADSEDGKSG